MKKILLILLALSLTINSSVWAKSKQINDIKESKLEEVVLDPLIGSEDDEVTQAISIEEDNVSVEKQETLKERLKNAYNIEVEKYDTANFLFKEILTKHFDEDSIIDRTNVWFGYNGDVGMKFTDKGDIYGRYDLNTVNVGYDVFLKNNNADFRVMLNYNPFTERNFVQNLFADVYVASNKIPHHRVLVGNSRPPVGVDGGAGPFTLPFIARSQIARNFGTVRRLGARISGNYSLVDYDFGVYSSDTYFQEFFPGAEFIGWINLKPLGKTDGKWGKLKMGAGMQGGHRDNNYCVTGAYVGWQYKRFSADFEWAHASGYNGPSGYSTDKHASGFYTTLSYMLTKKLQILARYDEFDPNRQVENNHKREFSAGLNYFIKGQALRVILNYVFCQNDNANNSHRIILGTQILL